MHASIRALAELRQDDDELYELFVVAAEANYKKFEVYNLTFLLSRLTYLNAHSSAHRLLKFMRERNFFARITRLQEAAQVILALAVHEYFEDWLDVWLMLLPVADTSELTKKNYYDARSISNSLLLAG